MKIICFQACQIFKQTTSWNVRRNTFLCFCIFVWGWWWGGDFAVFDSLYIYIYTYAIGPVWGFTLGSWGRLERQSTFPLRHRVRTRADNKHHCPDTNKWPQRETPNRAYRVYIGNKIRQNPQPQKSANKLDVLYYLAVWPDPTHGKCSYGHFKMLIRGKSDVFETY